MEVSEENIFAALYRQLFASELLLRISDTGKGFDPESKRGAAGLGLVSMRERLRLVGGMLSISGIEPNGTQIEVRVPIPHPDDPQLDPVS